MSKLRTLTILFVLLFSLGCATGHPIRNFESQPIADGVSSDRFAQVVMSTTRRGWVFQRTGPDTILGTLLVRSHEARVLIQYADNSYSIRYEDSVNLGENGNTIHRNYNIWVKNLNADIRRGMLQVASGAPAAATPASTGSRPDTTIQ